MTDRDLYGALSRAREWLHEDGGREVSVSITSDRVRVQLLEYARCSAVLTVGRGDSGEHYHDIQAELAHAIGVALAKATDRRTSGKEQER